MTKRETEAMGTLIIVALVVGLPIMLVVGVVSTALEAMGGALTLLLAVGAVAGAVWLVREAAKAKRARLMEKYGDADVVDMIMSKQIWQGQTPDQLLDSIGSPHARDEKILKTKTKEIWKYQHQGSNRYGLRVTVENGRVVGWDKKS